MQNADTLYPIAFKVGLSAVRDPQPLEWPSERLSFFDWSRRLSDEAPIATKVADLEAKINELEATNVELKAKNNELEAKLAAAAQQRGAAASAFIARREMNELRDEWRTERGMRDELATT